MDLIAIWTWDHYVEDVAAGLAYHYNSKAKKIHSMIELGDVFAPAAPATIEQTGVNAEVLANIVLKLAYTVPRFNTRWATERICSSLSTEQGPAMIPT